MLRKRMGHHSALAFAIILAVAGIPAVAEWDVDETQRDVDDSQWDVDANDTGDDERTGYEGESFSTGSVIFFHPDGTGANHWSAARMYFKGPDGRLNWDRLPHMALYRGHMLNNLIGTSNGGATTHAFGYRVDGLGSFGKNGDGTAVPPTDVFINGLSGYEGSIMREAANAGIPVGLVNDGHIGEPGTGCFLAEVGSRNNWQEITRQMIQGRTVDDTAPWVIMGGGEADTRPKGTTLVHRNHNEERREPLNANTSLRADDLDLELDWNDNGSGDTSNKIGSDDWIVIKTRAEFQALKRALARNRNYAPHVLGLFAYQDTFNDRNEEDLIARGKTDPLLPENYVGPLNGFGPGFRSKASRLILWGDVPFDETGAANPGYNPPTFKEMFQVTLTILDRAAKQQLEPKNRKFFLVAEQEANDNFGNNDNAIGMLQALDDTDRAIRVARRYVKFLNPDTLILTAADSDAGGLQVAAPYRNAVVEDAGNINLSNFTFGFNANPAAGSDSLPNIPDGLEGRGQNAPASTTSSDPVGTKMFLSEPDRIGQTMEFAISWPGTGDYAGAILSRAEGLNAELLNSKFSARFDNIDVYRMMYLTLFGERLKYPDDPTAVER